MHADEAYAHCEHVTRTEARNFAYGIRLLAPSKRAALSAVYAFSRRIDDIGDGDAPEPDKLSALARARADIDRIGTDTDDAVLVALGDAVRHHPIPLGAFGELIDGVEADVRGVHYDSIDDLVHYCRCVAGSIGRLSLGVFGGAEHPGAAERADALGVALQLTNILRDVREDLENHRVYLPAEDLDRYGVRLALDSHALITGPRFPLVELMRFEADRARTWYARGLELLPMLDARSAACCAAMAGIYRRLLDRIAARPDLALDRRVSLPTREKVVVAIGSLARAAAGTRALPTRSEVAPS
jgi:squalene synthase HpnD